MNRMVRIAALSLVAIVLSVSGLAAPVASFEKMTFDGGNVDRGPRSIPFEFLLENKGDEPLLIEKVRPFCSCTDIQIGSRKLAPGEKTHIKGQLKITHQEGVMRKKIAVHTNDPESPVSLLTVQVKIPYSNPGLHLMHRGKIIQIRVRNGRAHAVMILRNYEQKPVKIERIELPAGWTHSPALPFEIKPSGSKFFNLSRTVTEKDTDISGKVKVYSTSKTSPVIEGNLVQHK